MTAAFMDRPGQALKLGKLAEVTPAQRESFKEQGFLVLESVLDDAPIERLRSRFDPLFKGQFETGVYPDEWYWREGISLPEATRHMANAWKSDLSIARLVLSPDIGRLAAKLMGWSGARLGQDTLWWKPPQTKAIDLHQDASYMNFLDPAEIITCWFTLDRTRAHAGTIEYVPGSHRWPLAARDADFHSPVGGYRAKMEAEAARAGVNDPKTVAIEAPAGSCVFHHGHTWHGSGPNVTGDLVRRSIGAHLLPERVKFGPSGGEYIYGRYQRPGDDTLDESFFPVIWSENGYRTPFIDAYCATGRKSAGPAAS